MKSFFLEEKLNEVEAKAFRLWKKIDSLQFDEVTKLHVDYFDKVKLRSVLKDVRRFLESLEFEEKSQSIKSREIERNDEYIKKINVILALIREGNEPYSIMVDDVKNYLHYNIGNFKWRTEFQRKESMKKPYLTVARLKD